MEAQSMILRFPIETEALLFSEEQMRVAAARYHFTGEAVAGMLDLQSKIQSAIRCEAVFLKLEEQQLSGPMTYGKLALHRQHRYLGCISLGKRFDQVQQEYSRRELVSAAYQMDVLGMEYLNRACPVFAEKVRQRTGKTPGDYHYLEHSEHIRRICEWMEQCTDMPVRCSQYGVMEPVKTVLFRMGLYDSENCGDDKKAQCTTCPNRTCMYRRKSMEG